MVLWGTLIAYLAIMVGIGIYCRKKTSNVDDFVLAGARRLMDLPKRFFRLYF